MDKGMDSCKRILKAQGTIRFYVLNMYNKGAKVYAMSDGQYKALTDTLTFQEIGWMTMKCNEVDAVAYCADYIAAINAIRDTDVKQLLELKTTIF